jgi:hypothetical protein
MQVFLAEDAEFSNGRLMQQLHRRGWGYVLRQKGPHQVATYRHRSWQALADLVSGPRQCLWWAKARLTAPWAFRAHIFAYSGWGEDEHRLPATNLPDRPSAVPGRRMPAGCGWKRFL